MIQLNFTNVHAVDDGYGLKVNGRMLEDVISLALGTLSDLGTGYWSDTVKTGKKFESPLCNVSVTIDDRSADIKETIFFSDRERSVNDIPLSEYMEAVKNEYAKKAETGDTEE